MFAIASAKNERELKLTNDRLAAELNEISSLYNNLLQDYRSLDHTYQAHLKATHSHEKSSEKVLSLTMANSKLCKENELIRENL